MKTIRTLATIVLLVSVVCRAFPVLVQGPGPFMQRVTPTDFLAIERTNKLTQLATSELVIYATDEGRARSALSLVRKGDDYLLKFTSIGEEVTSRSSLVPAPIAHRAIESIQMLMEYQVFAPDGPQQDVLAGFGSNRWIALRVAPTQVIAGMVSGNTMHAPRGDRASAFCKIVNLLEDICRAAETDQPGLLVDLDRLTGRFLDAEKSAHPNK